MTTPRQVGSSSGRHVDTAVRDGGPPRLPSLLDAVLRDSLEPAYAARAGRAAARNVQAPARTGRPGGEGATSSPHRPPQSAPGRPRARARTTLVRTALAGCLAAVVLAVVTLRDGATRPDAVLVRQQLVDEVTRDTATVAALRREVSDLTTAGDAAAAAALARDERGRGLQELVAARSRQAGETPVSGAGLMVVASDTVPPGTAGGPASTAAVERGRVTDRDLQELVNVLLAAGAEAVSVSGTRVTTTSAVREAGGTVLVGLQPVSSPYEVLAVGPVGLGPSLAVSSVGRRLRAGQQLGGPRLDMQVEARVTVPAAAPVSLRYAAPTP